MSTSENLKLPLLLPAQAQKHVTVNEALSLLDVLAALVVVSADQTTPPANPANGMAYIVNTDATGDWLGKDGQIAAFINGGWVFITPAAGWSAWDNRENQALIFSNGRWSPRPAGQTTPRLGINATADDVNRLSVSSPASLLNHDGAGHQLKINKDAVSDTASLLYQRDFSGRAEMGLAGSDDFSVKVSADGVTWLEAMRCEPLTGTAVFENGLDSLQLIIPHNGVASISTPSSGGFLLVSMVNPGFPQSNANGILVYDTGVNPGLTSVWLGGSLENAGTTSLTGATGAAGKVSLSAQAGGTIQIEHRHGAGGGQPGQFCITWINGFRPA